VLKLKIKCDICDKKFDYPYEINLHKHRNLELDGVPVNFWTPIDYIENINFEIKKNENGIFKYENFFPAINKKLTLFEGNTKLKKISKNVYIKDESSNPTGSFKDRGMPLLMNEAIFHNKEEVAIVSTGNAAISLIEYAKLYNLKSTVFVPSNIIDSKKEKLSNADKIIYSDNIIDSFINFSKYCDLNSSVFNGYLSSNISYMIGLKTIYYEIFYQLGEKEPDYIFVPCASGSNVLACYYSWNDLLKKGLIKKIPKIVIVQIDGGNPIEQGFKNQCKNSLYIIDNPTNSKSLLSTDTCFNYFKIYDILENNHAETISITDEEMENYILKNNLNYDFNSISVFVAYEKKKKTLDENDIIVLIATAKESE
jgi:threonine synthase